MNEDLSENAQSDGLTRFPYQDGRRGQDAACSTFCSALLTELRHRLMLESG
ncbi:MAG: hypothetical protein WCO84_07150 [bacterium]